MMMILEDSRGRGAIYMTDLNPRGKKSKKAHAGDLCQPSRSTSGHIPGFQLPPFRIWRELPFWKAKSGFDYSRQIRLFGSWILVSDAFGVDIMQSIMHESSRVSGNLGWSARVFKE